MTVPTPVPKQIVLVRHGRPEGATNSVVNAAGFGRWVRTYNKSRVDDDSPPPDHLRTAFAAFLIASSDLPRAQHSAELCVGRSPDLVLVELREMDIPRFRMPLRMAAYSWLYLNRAMWMLGRGGPFESFAAAKARARRVATKLDHLAQSHPRIVVFGHGLLNQHVSAHLVTRGWQQEPAQRRDYWSVVSLWKTDGREADALEP